jgi:hypothetical protein
MTGSQNDPLKEFFNSLNIGSATSAIRKEHVGETYD